MSPLHRSLLLSSADRYGSLVIQLLAIAALSRLLTPSEFGVYSLVMALSALAHTLREFGGANYIIQKPALSEQCIRTAFTVSLLISSLFAVVLVALRDAAALFFSESGLREGVAVSALNFLLLPFSVTISALLRREMVFDALALCNVTANLATAVTSVALALIGLGFMGPVWGSVAGNVVLVGLLFAHKRNFRIFRPSFRNFEDLVLFGAYSSGAVVINVLYTWSPQIILGRVLGMTAVGLYTRSFNVIQLFDKLVLDVINPVIMPAVSARARSGGDVKRLYLSSLALVAALHWPFLICIALLADPIVRIMFGAQWIEIVPLVRMLSLASMSLFAACLTYPVLVSIGRVRDTLTASLISVPPSLLVMLIASFFGIEAVAAAAFVALPLQAYVALWFICRRIGVGALDLARAVWKSAIVAIGTALGVLLVIGVNGFNLALPLPEFFAAALAASAFWVLGLFATRHPMLTHLRAALAGSHFLRWASFPGSRLPAPTE